MLRMKEGAVFVEEAEDREKQLTEAVKEDCREVSDGGSLLLHCQEWGLYELSHELICSSLWPINSKGCQREKRRRGWERGLCVWGECYGASESTERSDREWARMGRLPWAQQLISEPSSSHRRVTGAISAANGSRFRILTKSEVLKNGKSLILTEKALSEFSRRSGFIREDYALWKTKEEGHGRRCTRKQIRQIRQCIGHEHDEMSAHGLWTKLEEMYREKTSQNKVLLRRLVLKLSERDYSGGTNERVPDSHRKRSKEEAKEEVSRRRSQRSGEEVKEEISADDGGGQNPEVAL
ncbi:hypothetical protein Acr_08g0007340 [Actinidia rufa]|uniref:Uncharacterized protein n=1 Tax=Actinidia rufa TaxID=165716 RepID=A0A7J0F0W6_9ERIC|nr:hypothetical protein Acr_08g0007340 [Actinidia rufa]